MGRCQINRGKITHFADTQKKGIETGVMADFNIFKTAWQNMFLTTNDKLWKTG